MVSQFDTWDVLSNIWYTVVSMKLVQLLALVGLHPGAGIYACSDMLSGLSFVSLKES